MSTPDGRSRVGGRGASGSAGAGTRVALCGDVGSTFTKVAAVDLDSGALLGTAAHRTTVDSDVLVGLDAAIAQVSSKLPRHADVVTTEVCSSAGGGLRLAVVGYEQLVTAEAGQRVALSAGARVVHVAAGELDRSGVADLRAARADVVLLVGGTDGGDAAVLRHNAGRLAAARVRLPIVVAGNVDARDEVVDVLTNAGAPVVATENVLPRIGVLNPQPARAAIREVFLRHVIGGKKLSRGPRFASLVRGATPDIVLTAIELLADHLAGDLVVVDIGGATTDVYSVLSPDPEAQVVTVAEVAGLMWRSRTVEGDLGVRWNAPGVVAAATAERLLSADRAGRQLSADRAGQQLSAGPAERRLGSGRSERSRPTGPLPPDSSPAGSAPAGSRVADVALAEAARVRAADPAYVPVTDSDQAMDIHIAALAAVIGLRRHARGKDLRRVRVLIGSGGVLRHAPAGAAQDALAAVLTDYAGGWALPTQARVSVDRDYVLAPAGLLAADHPRAALALLSRLVGEQSR